MVEDDFAGARAHFERALGLSGQRRYAYAKDAWRVRTYGQHILEEYFPHRELGVCLYRLGEPARAVEMLERSIDLEPSGRAKHYLNLARGAILEGQTLLPPEIRTGNPPESWTTLREYMVTGVVHAAGYARHITVNGNSHFIEEARRDQPFSRRVKLVEGDNLLDIRAVDLNGRTSHTQLVCRADWTPPTFMVQDVMYDNGRWQVHGVCADDRALARVEVNGNVQWTAPKGGRLERERDVVFEVSRGAAGIVHLQDVAGNPLSIQIDDLALSSLVAARGATRWAARASDAMPDVSGGTRKRPASAAVDPACRLVVPSQDQAVDVLRDEYLLEIRAEAPGGLVSVTVNTEELLSSGKHGVVQYYAARRVPLALGTNTLVVKARSAGGAVAARKLTVVRRLPDYRSLQYRLAVVVQRPRAVMDEHGLATRLWHMMQAEFVREPARFFLLERDRGWQHVVEEHLLNTGGVADPRARLASGAVLAEDLQVRTRILDSEDGYTLYAGVINAHDESILRETDVYVTEGGNWTYGVGGLVLKIEQAFPLVASRIRAMRPQVGISAGEREGVRPGSRFMVLRDDSGRDELAEAKVILAGERPAELHISEVDDRSGWGALHPGSIAASVRPGYHVFTR